MCTRRTIMIFVQRTFAHIDMYSNTADIWIRASLAGTKTLHKHRHSSLRHKTHHFSEHPLGNTHIRWTKLHGTDSNRFHFILQHAACKRLPAILGFCHQMQMQMQAITRLVTEILELCCCCCCYFCGGPGGVGLD